MAKYAVEGGIPIPEVTAGGGKLRLYPIPDLAVGESFFVPADTEEEGKGEYRCKECYENALDGIYGCWHYDFGADGFSAFCTQCDPEMYR